MNHIKVIALLSILGCLCLALSGATGGLQPPVVAQESAWPHMVDPAAGPAISGSNFEGSGAFAVQSNASVEALGNWWGHANGPTHPTNPGGLGQRVSDNVSFSPWLVSPANIGLSAPSQPAELVIIVTCSKFQGNAAYGIQSMVPVLAESNWWGESGGPTHATNLGGRGDRVSDNVDFAPWLTSPDASCHSGSLTPAVQPLWPPTHSMASTVMEGGKLLRHFRLVDEQGDPLQGATIAFSRGESALADATGHFTYTIPASTLGGTGSYPVDILSVTYLDETYTGEDLPDFEVQVASRSYTMRWDLRNRGSVSIVLASGGGENRSSVEVRYGDTAQDADDVLTFRRSVDPEFGVGVDTGIGLGISRVFDVGIKGTKTGVFYFPHREAWVFSDPYNAYDIVGRNTQALLLVDALERALPRDPISMLLHWLAEQAYSRANPSVYVQSTGDGYGVRGRTTGWAGAVLKNPATNVELAGLIKGATQEASAETIGASIVRDAAGNTVAQQSRETRVQGSLTLRQLGHDEPVAAAGVVKRRITGGAHEELDQAIEIDRTPELATLSLSGIATGLREITTIRPLDETSIALLNAGVQTYNAFTQFDAGQDATLHLSADDAQQEADQLADLLAENAVAVERTWDLLLPATVQDIGFSLKFGFGVEVRYDWEVRKQFVKERGAVIAGQMFPTEVYEYDDYIRQEGKGLSAITGNALGSINIPGLGQARTGPAGGTIRTGPAAAAGELAGPYAEVVIPPGALAAETDIAVVPLPYAGYEGFVGPAYMLLPEGLQLLSPAMLKVYYGGAEPPGDREHLIGLYTWSSEEARWRMSAAQLDTARDTVASAVTRFATHALILDDRAPLIENLNPAPGLTMEETTPVISAQVKDPGTGVSAESLVLELDGVAVTPAYHTDVAGTALDLRYQRPEPLAEGTHDLRLAVADRAGNQAAPITWSFSIKAGPTPTSRRVYVPLLLHER